MEMIKLFGVLLQGFGNAIWIFVLTIIFGIPLRNFSGSG